MILPPRSRRGGPRLLCGLHHRHVGHSASRVHTCSWKFHGIFIAKKSFFKRVCFGFGCGGIFSCFYVARRTTVRTCPFVSPAVSLDVQQYSRVQQKSLSINNPRSHHVCTIIARTEVLRQKKKPKRRDGEIQLTLCPEWSALPLNQQKM